MPAGQVGVVIGPFQAREHAIAIAHRIGGGIEVTAGAGEQPAHMVQRADPGRVGVLFLVRGPVEAEAIVRIQARDESVITFDLAL